MSVTINQPQTSVEVHTQDKRPTLELQTSTNGETSVNLVGNETTIVSQTATYSPSGESGLAAHIADPTPHPAYDVDIMSLNILFENGLI